VTSGAFAHFLADWRSPRYARQVDRSRGQSLHISNPGDDAMEHAVQRHDLVRLLESSGLRATQQRIKVAEVLVAAPVHMTADQLIAQLRASGTSVSKATVYNTLHVLATHGLVRPLHLDPTRVVYDSRRATHHHFHDVDSGELLDIDPDAIEFRDLPTPPLGMEIESVEVVIRVRRKSVTS
jgi:Fur family iron response transcriptional regulator